MEQKTYTDHSDGLAYSLFNTCSTKGKMETKILFNDGRTEQAINYDLSISYSSILRGAQYDGYDLVSIYCLYRNYSTNTINVNDIEAITVDLILPNDNTPNTLTFSVSGVHHDDVYNRGHLDIIGANDTIEVVSGSYTQQSIDITNSRDIILYLHKDYVDPREEISWDPSINPFVYIIQQQYYEILPNPNAATTLYTDYNITSSKIITIDNITTMRSDLNIVTNTVDVVAYDVSDIKVRVDVLDSEIAETKKVTQHLQEDIDNVRVISNVALAFGVIGTVGSISSIGMQLASSGISSSTSIGTKAIKNVCSEPAEYEMAVEKVTTLFTSLPIQTRSIVTDISPIVTWCNEEYKPLSDLDYEEEYDNPKSKVLSLHTGLDLINRFRDSLKPAFKLIANRLNEVTYNIENIDITDQLTTLDNKFKEYIRQDELIRSDTIDVFASIDNENNVINLTFEDNIVEGLIVFKTFTTLNGNSRQRRFYIKIIDGTINEYKGVTTDTTIDGNSIKGLASSETDRVTYMPSADLIQDSTERLISIPITDSSYKISGVIVELCTCTRQMNYSVSDIAYLSDIDALNKKINSLAKMSHNNDIATLSLQEDYVTIDEVNNVLTNNYVQKKDLPNSVDMTNYYNKGEVDTLLEEMDSNMVNYCYGKEYIDENIYTIYQTNEKFLLKTYLDNYYNKIYIKENYVDFEELNNYLVSYAFSKNELEEGLYWKNQIDNMFALKISIPDMTNYVLKTDYEELKAKITTLELENTLLKNQVSLLKPSYPWSAFYPKYEEITNMNGKPMCYYFFYTFDSTKGNLTISFVGIMGTVYDNKNYLCVLIVNNPAAYYVFRISLTEKKVYVNEYKGSSISIPFTTTTYSVTLSNFVIQDITSTNTTIRYRFDYVFMKDSDS